MLSKLREPFNGLSHLIGAMAGFVGLIAMLIIARGNALKVASVLVYSFGLMAMFLASGIYHSAMVGPAALQTLRKIDHSAIFLLIAGSYTPFCLLAFTGFWHWGLLALIWAIAAIGIVVKVFYVRSPRWLHTSVTCPSR